MVNRDTLTATWMLRLRSAHRVCAQFTCEGWSDRRWGRKPQIAQMCADETIGPRKTRKYTKDAKTIMQVKLKASVFLARLTLALAPELPRSRVVFVGQAVSLTLALAPGLPRIRKRSGTPQAGCGQPRRFDYALRARSPLSALGMIEWPMLNALVKVGLTDDDGGNRRLRRCAQMRPLDHEGHENTRKTRKRLCRSNEPEVHWFTV